VLFVCILLVTCQLGTSYLEVSQSEPPRLAPYPGHAALGNVLLIASILLNGLRRRCLRSSLLPFLLGVIVAKEHVMVN